MGIKDIFKNPVWRAKKTIATPRDAEAPNVFSYDEYGYASLSPGTTPSQELDNYVNKYNADRASMLRNESDMLDRVIGETLTNPTTIRELTFEWSSAGEITTATTDGYGVSTYITSDFYGNHIETAVFSAIDNTGWNVDLYNSIGDWYDSYFESSFRGGWKGEYEMYLPESVSAPTRANASVAPQIDVPGPSIESQSNHLIGAMAVMGATEVGLVEMPLHRHVEPRHGLASPRQWL